MSLLVSDKHHQILFAVVQMHTTNPATIVKKIEKLPYLSIGLTDRHKILHFATY